MIIKALAAAADYLDVPPQGYQVAATPWALTVTAAGVLQSLVPLQVPDAAGRPTAMRQPVPKVSRTLNVAPQVACDTGVYVLGLAKPVTGASSDYNPFAPTQRDISCHEAWVDMLLRWRTESGDAAAAAVLAWIRAGKPDLERWLPPEGKELESLAAGNIAIYLAGDPAPAHLRASATAFWARHVSGSKASRAGICSSCGSAGPIVDTFPSLVPIRYAPGAGQTSGAALTSANFPTASRDLRITQMANAPTCLDCAARSVAALTALAANAQHCWRGDDAWTVWWLRSGDTPGIFSLLDEVPTPAQVTRMFDQVREGVRDPFYGNPDDEYYALTYSARGPRIVIRSWISGSLRETAEAIAAFFADAAVVPAFRPDRQWEPLWAMAMAAGDRRHRAGKIEQKPPPGSHEALTRAALTPGYPPAALLAAAVRRSRSEIGLAEDPNRTERREHSRREHARASLVRLILTRSPHLNGDHPVPGPLLDHASTDPAYLCGRLFAEYESAQRVAMGGDVNATITDRMYGKAMTNPAAVYPALDRLSKAHLRKLRTSGRQSAATSAERRIAGVIAGLNGFPAALDVPGQARWMLGYYQQRAANINAALAARAHSDKGAAETAPGLVDDSAADEWNPTREELEK